VSGPRDESGSDAHHRCRDRAGPRNFAAFYDRHYPRLLRFFARRTRDAQSALDLTAETFARAFEGRSSFRGSTEPEALGWLFKIASGQLSQFYRRGRVETAALERLQLERPVASDDELERIEALIDAEAASDDLAAALEGLSADDRTAVEQHVIAGLSYAEIAALGGDPSAVAVRVRTWRALRRLAAHPRLRRLRGDSDDV
jgi:RNA polymerase sigma-70 factor (ECF subfamily)